MIDIIEDEEKDYEIIEEVEEGRMLPGDELETYFNVGKRE